MLNLNNWKVHYIKDNERWNGNTKKTVSQCCTQLLGNFFVLTPLQHCFSQMCLLNFCNNLISTPFVPMSSIFNVYKFVFLKIAVDLLVKNWELTFILHFKVAHETEECLAVFENLKTVIQRFLNNALAHKTALRFNGFMDLFIEISRG